MKRGVQIAVVMGMLAAAISVRFALALGSPTPFGYVYDFYHEPILLYQETGDLPEPSDCWQCYHPPLFTLIGSRILSLGMAGTHGDTAASLWWLSLSTMAVSCVFMFFVYLIVRRYVADRKHLLVLTALLLSMPCLFISSFAIESDLLCATFILISFYLYLRYTTAKYEWLYVVLMGLFTGLAAATKYSGLIIFFVLISLMGYSVIKHPKAIRLAHLVLYLCVSVTVGGLPYLKNYQKEGQLIVGNAAWRHLRSGDKRLHFDHYDFDTFQLNRIIQLMKPDAPSGELNDFSVYDRSVLSSLYGQVWTDCSIFSNPSRHGLKKGLYPAKAIPVWLVSALLVAGLVPVLVGGVGSVKAVRNFSTNLPLLALAAVSLGLYVRWFLSYDEWMLKAKYLLYLAPVGLVLCAYGLESAKRVHRHLETFLITLLYVVTTLSTAYCLSFAIT